MSDYRSVFVWLNLLITFIISKGKFHLIHMRFSLFFINVPFCLEPWACFCMYCLKVIYCGVRCSEYTRWSRCIPMISAARRKAMPTGHAYWSRQNNMFAFCFLLEVTVVVFDCKEQILTNEHKSVGAFLLFLLMLNSFASQLWCMGSLPKNISKISKSQI